MKKYLLIILLISNYCLAQSLSTLDNKNGFRNIKLNNDIKSYPNFEKSIAENFSDIWDYGISRPYYELKNRYNTGMSINNSKILNIELSTVNNKISEIIISIEFDGDLHNYMSLVYGKPTKKFSNKKENYPYRQYDTYIWETEKIICNLNSYSENIKTTLWTLSYHHKGLEEIFKNQAKEQKENKTKKKRKKAISEF